jgi:hypothetical protein
VGASNSGIGGGLRRPKITGFWKRDSGTWILRGRLINPPCGWYGYRNQGFAETA